MVPTPLTPNETPTMGLRDWLKANGFANFTCFGQDEETYENRPVSNGGIRITIAGDIAHVRMARTEETIPTKDLQSTVQRLLGHQP